MKRINISIEDKVYAEIQKKAKSFGLKPTSYVTRLALEAFRQRHENSNLKAQLKMIRALIPAFVEIVGNVEKMDNDQLQALEKRAQKIWEEAYTYEENKLS